MSKPITNMITLRTNTKIEGNLTASTGKFGNEKSVISVTEDDITFKTPVFGVSTERTFGEIFKMLDDAYAKTGAMRPSDEITDDYNKEGRLPSFPIPDGDYTIALTDGIQSYSFENSSLSIENGNLTTGYMFDGDDMSDLVTEMLLSKPNVSTYSVKNYTALVIPTIVGIDPSLRIVYFKIIFAGYDMDSDYTTYDAGDYIYRWNAINAELHVSLGKVDLTTELPAPASDAILITYGMDTFDVSAISTIERLNNGQRYGFHVSYAGMFKDRSTLTKIDLSQWSFANVTDMSEMFMGCYGLDTSTSEPSIDMRRANPNAGCVVNDIFKDCTTDVKLRLIGSGTLWKHLILRDVDAGWSEPIDGLHHPGAEPVDDHNNRQRWSTKNDQDASYIMLIATASGEGKLVVDGKETYPYTLDTWYGRLFGSNGGKYLYGHDSDVDYRFDNLTGELVDQYAIINLNWYCGKSGCGGHHNDTSLTYPSTSTET